MRDLDETALEGRLREVLEERLGALPLDLTIDALDRRREAKRAARRVRRGRGITLLAAALLLVGGVVAAGSGLLRRPAVVPPVPRPSVIALATASPDASASPFTAAGPGGVWIRTGTMGTPRHGHAAVRLLDGRVLVVGGEGASGESTTSAELYDPATGTWSATENVPKPLFGNAAVLLRDGRVIVAGRDRAQVYDPASGTWTATRPRVPGSGRSNTFTLLRDGRVLDAEGAQVYDPASGDWTATGKRTGAGFGAAAVLLSDGRVLVAGGTGFKAPNDYFDVDSAEVYDPLRGTYSAIARMRAKADPLGAFPQADGKVLVVGSDSLQVYDPATDAWTGLPGSRGARYDDASLLSDGTVLLMRFVSDGADRAPCVAADLYDPDSGSWTSASTMLDCHGEGRSLTVLLDGTVLVAGGAFCGGRCVTNGAPELYVPIGVPLPPLPAFPSPPPPAVPSPTPVPAPFPPAMGPLPQQGRSWTVTVDNKSSEPATLFVAELAEDGTLRLVGSATPNVVAAGATVKVAFVFPAEDSPDNGGIFVNPRPGEGGPLVKADQIGIPGKILITADGQEGWLSP